MKKRLILPLMITLSAPTYADFVGIYGGVGMWNASMDGNVGVGDEPVTADELGLDGENNTHFFIALEHPVPVLPNIRLSYSELTVKGTATVDREFTLDNQTFAANADTATEIDLSHTDLTLYYEILDNWVSLDVGLTARALDGYAEITASYPEESGLPDDHEKVDLNVVLPLLYGKAQFDLPFSGWYVGGSLNYISVSDNTFSDLEAKVGYMTSGLGLDFGFEAGLRQVKLEAGNDDDLNADVTVDGPFAKLIFHF